ncbi:IS5 family transposase [Paracraurococcus lichenis]|uniref:IS5 family transposase n=1 Tax=Paracraurococcus lichenis TaxID=3064888 RepID=A0ABT9EEB7_9PROT|nr:IS5 family transposase [Paracraurococcus sp. LOR1-02]MDO9714557.1 IS5 family transposase [Paracraurococcus sp. LOR1-02]
MWTPADRALVGDFGSGQALTDDQFRLLKPLIPPAKPGGRPRSTDIRNLLDGLFYLVRTGCQWRHLPPPPAFPPWRTVYGYLRAFLRDGVWESIRHHFVVMLREGAGREASPTAAIVDTQSVKTTESGGPRGWDAAKRLKGRKRQVAVDTDGLLLGILVHAGDIQDADSLGDLLRRLKPLYAWLRVAFADSAYNRLAALLACYLAGLVLIIVRRVAGTNGFVVQPRRWVIERSLGWFGRWRRLSKDYEALPEVSEAMVTLAAIRLMLHRLCHPNRRRLPAP